jgi:hypothetical protein
MNRDLLPLAPYKSALCCIIFILACLPITGCQQAGPETYDLRVPAMVVKFDNAGAIQQIGFTGSDSARQVRAFTRLRDCELEGKVEITRSDSQLSFQRRWISRANGNSARVTDRFSRGNGSLRWEVEVAGLRGTWSTPIETHLIYPDSVSAKFWTAWGDPRLGDIRSRARSQQTSIGILPSDVTGNWSDPLLPIPFVNDTIWYGAPPYSYENPRIGFIPFQGNLIGIPLVTISEEQGDRGLSLIQSPADTLFDMNLRVRSSGEMVLSREYHRISPATSIRIFRWRTRSPGQVPIHLSKSLLMFRRCERWRSG